MKTLLGPSFLPVSGNNSSRNVFETARQGKWVGDRFMKYMNRPQNIGTGPWRWDARQEASEPYGPTAHPNG
jgi:hypothetical protein